MGGVQETENDDCVRGHGVEEEESGKWRTGRRGISAGVGCERVNSCARSREAPSSRQVFLEIDEDAAQDGGADALTLQIAEEKFEIATRLR